MVNIIRDIPSDIKIFCEKALDKNFERALTDYLIGTGSHGRVYNIPNSNYVIKFFNAKAVAGKYLDYIYLDIFQGIDAIPTMYAYAENKYVVMEKVEGINLLDYLKEHGEYPEELKNRIVEAITQIFERKIAPVDLKIFEHIIYIENEDRIKILDFGVCDNLNHMSDEFTKNWRDEKIESILEELNSYEKAFQNSK